MTRLGVGVLTYFSLYRTYIFFFLLMALVNLPLVWIYQTNAVYSVTFGSYSLGSLGQSEVHCQVAQIQEKQIYLSCSQGVISAITDFGVFAGGSDAETYGSCSTTSGLDTKLPDSCAYWSSNTSSLYENYLSNCLNRENCTVKSLD